MYQRTCVILVNYKSAYNTANCVESLTRSTVPLSVVVVDNTPNDSELDVLLSSFHNITLLRAPENLGFGRGNNLGIEWALKYTNCEFILILNNDTTIECDAVSKLEEVLDSNPNAAMATSRIVLMSNPKVLWYGGGEISWLRGAAKAPGYLGLSDTSLAMQSREVSFASGCVMLIRRDVMQQLGGFDERFFMYEEDVELCLRIRECGWGIRYEPTSLVHHVAQASTESEGEFVDRLSPLNDELSFYTYHAVRNRLINMRLHARGINRYVFMVGFTLLLFKKTIQFVTYNRWDAVVAIIKGFYSYRKCFVDGESKNVGDV